MTEKDFSTSRTNLSTSNFKNITFSMSTVEIAAQTGKRHDHVLRDARVMLTELYGEDGLSIFGERYKAADNNFHPCYNLSKNDVLTLVSGYSIQLRAKIIRRLDELENGVSVNREEKETFELEMIAAKYAAEMLHWSEASTLEIIHNISDNHGISTKALPIYTKAVKVTFSAKDLLVKNECGISSIAFNKLMVVNNLLEEKTRTGSHGKTKKFKSLSKAGLEYGQNDTNLRNPRETQPHYFEDSFMDLYRIITGE